jgi:uncharacterized membrane protein
MLARSMKTAESDVVGGRRPGGGESWRFGLLVVAPAVALHAAARLWRLDESCLWFDELFGVHAARHAWGAMPRFVALDLVHPPLFYLLLKVWMGLGGESVWWLRLLPAAASSLAAVPIALLARELKLSAPTAALALLLAAASGFLIKYAQEVRMYAPLLLFASCSLWLFARSCRAGDEDSAGPGGGEAGGARRARRAGPGALFALAAANLLLVYTHYFGWMLVALELTFAAAWARSRLKFFAASVLVLAACFAPWAWAVAGASEGASGGGLQQNIGWAARPRPLELFLPYLLLHEPFRFQRHSAEPAVLRLTVVMTLLLFAPALAALALRELKRALGRCGTEGETRAREKFPFRFLVFFSAAPVLSAFVLARLLPQSVWGTRHLVIVAPAYLLLAAYAVTSLRPRWLSAVVHLLIGFWLLLAAAGWLTRPAAPLVWCSWETLAAQLARAEAASGRAVTVYAAEELAAYHLWHALDGGGVAGGAGFRVVAIKNVPGLVEDRAFFLPRGFDEVPVVDASAAMREDDFWIAFRAPAADGDHPLFAALVARGYQTGERFEASAQGQKVTLVRVMRR